MKKKQYAPKKSDMERESQFGALLVHVLSMTTDRFLGIFSLPCLCISTCQVSVRTLPAFTLLWYVLCFSILDKKNDFPSYELSEGEEKCIFLRTFSVSKLCMLAIANTSVLVCGVS